MDINKIALKIVGSKKAINQAQESFVTQGMSFEELCCGTNAIDLSINLNRSFYTTPESHYCDFLRDWYVFSTPLKTGNAISIMAKEDCINHELAVVSELLAYKVSNEFKIRKNQYDIASISDIKLTKRQLEILKTLARGYTDMSSALELGISLGTVRYHKSNIFKQFNVESCIQAIIKALKLNFISMEDIEI